MSFEKKVRHAIALLALAFQVGVASAGLFDDEDARKDIRDLRQRVDTVRSESEQGIARAAEDTTQLRRSLLELQNQIELLRSDLAKLKGTNEQIVHDVTDMQRRQKDLTQGFDERLRQFEPLKVTVDGREFLVDPVEKKDYETALTIFRTGDFAAAQVGLVDFLRRYPQSGYGVAALFWLGNAQYATRDYKEAVINFRAMIAKEPNHVRAPEAVLSIANCQIELKDAKGAKKTLSDLVKAYPQSEAAIAAKERLSRLK